MHTLTHQITEKDYKNGLFPQVPALNPGYNILLLNSANGKIIPVTELTTPRMISRGKYNKIIEVQTTRNLCDIVISSPSESDKYLFNVAIKVYVTVRDSLAYYLQKDTDFLKLISDILYPLIRKTTRCYDVVDYDSLEDIVKENLKAERFGDEIDCISFELHDIQVKPNEEAMEYVKRKTDAKLKLKIKKAEADSVTEVQKYQSTKATELTANLENAILQEVVDGKITSSEAIERINAFHQQSGEQKLENMNQTLSLLITMRDKGILTDTDVEKQAKQLIYNATASPDADTLLEEETSHHADKDDFPTSDEIRKARKKVKMK